MLTKADLLEPLHELRRDEIVVTSMGVVRPWGRLSSHALDFASADSAMGHTADLALGIAMARPDRRVVCLNGDGSMLMSLGTLVTAVESDVENLKLFVVVNRTYEITGNQPVPGASHVDFAAMASAAGFRRVHHFVDPETYRTLLASIVREPGSVFVSVDVASGSEGPISRSETESAHYLKTSLKDDARRFRDALQR